MVTARSRAIGAMDMPASWPRNVKTLAIDVGGTGLKASVLDAKGEMTVDRLRVETPYPCPPQRLIRELTVLAKQLPDYDRVSVGFPGLVRLGKVVNIPSLSRDAVDGETDPELVRVWHGYPLEARLRRAFGKPLLLANDADVAGCGVVAGKGFELVLTLGTGLGTALFEAGELVPHLEMAHLPFRKGETFEEQLGNVARKAVGNDRWNARVVEAIAALHAGLFFDHVYLGGGNARKLQPELFGEGVSIIDNSAGILGGIKLWERHAAARRA